MYRCNANFIAFSNKAYRIGEKIDDYEFNKLEYYEQMNFSEESNLVSDIIETVIASSIIDLFSSDIDSSSTTESNSFGGGDFGGGGASGDW